MKNAYSAGRGVIFKYVICQRLCGKLGVQKMADLAKESTEEARDYCDLDKFGPFLIFTCLASRAVHLQVCKGMETDSFIQALKRFIRRRGTIWTMRSNNGSNFVRTKKELLKA